ncbi:hypothetical protein CT19431_MP80134 [Cupriavidus taiwanensis]|nr:hypothetical protein CT19431_MP80134 [Cupriavidus taiwanensis]
MHDRRRRLAWTGRTAPTPHRTDGAWGERHATPGKPRRHPLHALKPLHGRCFVRSPSALARRAVGRTVRILPLPKYPPAVLAYCCAGFRTWRYLSGNQHGLLLR